MEMAWGSGRDRGGKVEGYKSRMGVIHEKKRGLVGGKNGSAERTPQGRASEFCLGCRCGCEDFGTGLFPSALIRADQRSILDTGAHTHTHARARRQGCVLTVTFHPLVDEPVQQRTTVVTEGGAAVCVDLELVLASGVLGKTNDMGKPLKIYIYIFQRGTVPLVDPSEFWNASDISFPVEFPKLPAPRRLHSEQLSIIMSHPLGNGSSSCSKTKSNT